MTLTEYIRKYGAKDLADKVGTSPAYLSQIANFHRKPGPKLSLNIEVATKGLVKASELRPDLAAIFSMEKKSPCPG